MATKASSHGVALPALDFEEGVVVKELPHQFGWLQFQQAERELAEHVKFLSSPLEPSDEFDEYLIRSWSKTEPVPVL